MPVQQRNEIERTGGVVARMENTEICKDEGEDSHDEKRT